MEFYQSIESICFIWRVLPAWKMPQVQTACPEFYFQYVDEKYLVINYNKKRDFYLLEDKVIWPGYVSLFNNTFQLQLRKQKPGNWTNPLKVGRPQDGYMYMWQKQFLVTVTKKVMLSDKMCVITMEHDEKVYNYLGPGRFINLAPHRKDQQSKYPFYVLPRIPTVMQGDEAVPNFNIGLDEVMDTSFSVLSRTRKLKTTPERLCNVTEGDKMKVSKPKGTFCLSMADHREIVVIIAYEIGILPALTVAIEVLRKNKDKKVRLLHVNRSDLNILMAREVYMIAMYEKRFTYEYLIIDPSPKYKGMVGNFSGDIFTRFIDEPCARDNHLYLICGEVPFIFQVAKLIRKEYSANRDQVFRLMI